MGVINRLLLLLLSLAMLALSVAVFGAAAGLMPEAIWLNELNYVAARKETLVMALIAFFISLRLVFAVFRRDKGEDIAEHGEYIIAGDANGEVRVALEAIRNLVEHLVLETRGVRDVRVKTIVKRGKERDELALKLGLIIGREVEADKLAQELTTRIQSQLVHTMALANVPVNIVITNISDAPPVRKHRVV